MHTNWQGHTSRPDTRHQWDANPLFHLEKDWENSIASWSLFRTRLSGHVVLQLRLIKSLKSSQSQFGKKHLFPCGIILRAHSFLPWLVHFHLCHHSVELLFRCHRPTRSCAATANDCALAEAGGADLHRLIRSHTVDCGLVTSITLLEVDWAGCHKTDIVTGYIMVPVTK